MPYVEVYLGSELVGAEVTPPSALTRFEQAISAAYERLRAASSSRRGANRQLVLLRQLLREKQEDLARQQQLVATRQRRPRQTGADERTPPRASEDSVAGGFVALGVAPPRWQGLPAALRRGATAEQSRALSREKRRAPLRALHLQHAPLCRLPATTR